MRKPSGKRNLGHLFLIPSFYGAITWGFCLFIYWLRLVEWHKPASVFIGICLLAQLAFMTSVAVFAPYYRTWRNSCVGRGDSSVILRKDSARNLKILIVSLHLVGFVGIIKYVYDFSSGFGGISGFFLVLFSSSYEIRHESRYLSSIGTQLSYFGWVAIGLTMFELANKRIAWWWFIMVSVQFIINLMYIDRTRPIWLMFVAVLMLLAATPGLSSSKILRWGSILVAVGGLVFLGLAEWIGKVTTEGQYGSSGLPLSLQNMYVYATGSFAYFNEILSHPYSYVSYVPERIFAPLFKVAAAVGSSDPPPNEVLNFVYVPFPVNTGTFLEPFYEDGGMLFMLFGVMLYSFCFDFLGLKLLQTRKTLPIFLWANLCFAAFIGFFVPKIGSTAIWLFAALGLTGSYFQHPSFRRK